MISSYKLVDELQSALALGDLVQSFSGVRTIFGHNSEISPAHSALACAYGYCYARRTLRPQRQVLLLGKDPRPTGGSLGRALVRGFLAGAAQVGADLQLIDLGIITTPLAETAVRALNADGGVMITASHNPLDHNGFKFLTGCGRNSRPDSAPPGALLSAAEMGAVIADVQEIAHGVDDRFVELAGAITPDMVEKALYGHDNETPRIQTERAYLDITGSDWGIAPHCLKPLTLGPALLDPNGGAGCGIDARVLEHFGVRVIEINAELGYPEHGIDTDGIDPASGRHMLMRVARAAARERAHFGVAFDYDADRGNLVLPGHDETAIIQPQQVSAFNIALALARRRLNGRANGRLAVVMSDATSLACVRVAEVFGAQVFLVETGEINVVSKMHQLRQQGYDVPVGVEGANGGTVFESSTCRDGLQVALSAALAESQPEVAQEWLRMASALGGAEHGDGRSLSLPELISSVPVNPNVHLRLASPPLSHAELKGRVERLFVDMAWPRLRGTFDNYEFLNFEGVRQVAERSGDESGGWRVDLSGPFGRAFVFLRGSKTEAGVWRMIVDADTVEGFNALEPAAREIFQQASQE